MTSTVIVETVFAALIGEQLLTHYSFKSQFSLSQIIFIIVIWFFGILIFYNIEKKYSLRVNGSKSAKNESQEETNTTQPPKKI
jgi:uncharacterized membrane protein